MSLARPCQTLTEAEFTKEAFVRVVRQSPHYDKIRSIELTHHRVGHSVICVTLLPNFPRHKIKKLPIVATAIKDDFILELDVKYYDHKGRPIDSDDPKDDPKEDTVCTMEVKACPDGTLVSRKGPSCQFTKCPPSKNRFRNIIRYWSVYSVLVVGLCLVCIPATLYGCVTLFRSCRSDPAQRQGYTVVSQEPQSSNESPSYYEHYPSGHANVAQPVHPPSYSSG